MFSSLNTCFVLTTPSTRNREKKPFSKLKMSFFLVTAQILILSIVPILGSTVNPCQPTRCRNNGPLIQFPFRLQNLQPQHCGYPGFNLHCDQNQETILQLPNSLNVSLRDIDYSNQRITFYDSQRCLARKLPSLNLSSSHFHFFNENLADYVLFNCSTALERDSSLVPITCLGVDGYQVFSIRFDTDVFSLTNCTRVFEVRSVPGFAFRRENLRLNWTEPGCGICERNSSFCSLSSNGQIMCSPKPTGPSKIPLIAGTTVGSILFVATVVALFFVYRSIKTDKKIEKFLKDYEALKPTRFSYADLKRITKDFSEKLGEGSYGVVYKGKLSKEIYVAVKVLNSSKGNGEEFVNEVKTIGSIHHVNIVRLVGFCADGFRRALVYDYLTNDSLAKFIFQNGPKKDSLSWEKMQDVAIGIAKGIEYLHQGCDQQILHFDIKPHNVLLDQNLNPKICDFGLAKFCSKEQSAVSMTDARGTMGYIAPEMMSRTFGRVSYKSDVYSFGMMLLEMVGGRKNIDTTKETNQVFFPKWVYTHLSEGGEVLVKIDESNVDEDGIIRKLVVVGLWCIQWYPADRPSMKMVVQMLEGDGESLSLPPNPFPSTNVGSNVVGVNGRFSGTELAVVPESDDNLLGAE